MPSSLFETIRSQHLAPFNDALSNAQIAAACLVSSRELSDAAQSALQASLVRLGYAPGDIASVRADKLPEGALFTVLEALDPLCVVLCDRKSTEAAAREYNHALNFMTAEQLLGKGACCFEDFEAMLQSSATKQDAWAVLKTLPRRYNAL